MIKAGSGQSSVEKVWVQKGVLDRFPHSQGDPSSGQMAAGPMSQGLGRLETEFYEADKLGVIWHLCSVVTWRHIGLWWQGRDVVVGR